MRSSALQEFAASARTDPAAARRAVLARLTDGGGPLIEPIGDGRVLVTFVLIGPTDPPAVRCPLFPGMEPSVPMQQVPGTDDVWWAEVEAQDDMSTLYQYQRRIVELPTGDDRPLHDPEVMAAYVRELMLAGYADPVNPESFAADDSDVAPEIRGQVAGQWESALTLPGAEPYRWHRDTADKGRLHERRLESALLGNTRTVQVWTPPGHHTGTTYPVVVLLDGESMTDPRVRADLIFDKLVADGAVPPFVALLVHNAAPTSRMTEYPCHPLFPDVIADELLPALRAEFALSGDPADVTIGGYSYGGLASDWIGFRRPDAIGNVLSMSASLWWGKRQQGQDDADISMGRDDKPEWLTRQFEAEPARPVRFWIDVGILESAPIPFADGVSQVSASRRFRDVLAGKGYPIAGYLEQPGGHDLLNWRRTLPLGLIALRGGATS